MCRAVQVRWLWRQGSRKSHLEVLYLGVSDRYAEAAEEELHRAHDGQLKLDVDKRAASAARVDALGQLLVVLKRDQRKRSVSGGTEYGLRPKGTRGRSRHREVNIM